MSHRIYFEMQQKKRVSPTVFADGWAYLGGTTIQEQLVAVTTIGVAEDQVSGQINAAIFSAMSSNALATPESVCESRKH